MDSKVAIGSKWALFSPGVISLLFLSYIIGNIIYETLRPVSFEPSRRILVASNEIQTMDNEMTNFIIYCLNCIR